MSLATNHFQTRDRIPDLSRYDQTLNGQCLKDKGYFFAFLRCSDSYFLPEKDGKTYTYKRHTDAYYHDNAAPLKSVGIPHIPYHYCRFDLARWGRDNPSVEQENLNNVLAAVKGHYPTDGSAWVVLDLEQVDAQLLAGGLTPAKVSAMTDNMVRLFSQHFKVLIYTFAPWADKWLIHSKEAQKRPLWIARYPGLSGDLPIINTSTMPQVPRIYQGRENQILFWQYTSKLSTGCTERSPGGDMSLMKFETRAQLCAWLGDKPEQPPQNTATVTARPSLRLREGPTLNARIVTTMPKGATVDVLKSDNPAWWFVGYGVLTGWAYSKYLSAPPMHNIEGRDEILLAIAYYQKRVSETTSLERIDQLAWLVERANERLKSL